MLKVQVVRLSMVLVVVVQEDIDVSFVERSLIVLIISTNTVAHIQGRGRSPVQLVGRGSLNKLT
jgi:hypothetical protein